MKVLDLPAPGATLMTQYSLSGVLRSSTILLAASTCHGNPILPRYLSWKYPKSSNARCASGGRAETARGSGISRFARDAVRYCTPSGCLDSKRFAEEMPILAIRAAWVMFNPLARPCTYTVHWASVIT